MYKDKWSHSRRGNRAEMDDILIVSSHQSEAAAMWVNYLKLCFRQINRSRNKPPFKIMCVGLEDIVGPQVLPLANEERMMNVKLQIVILCPQFLHHIYENPGPATTLGRLLHPDRVLAMLLGVDESAVTEQHRAALISYQQWHHLPVRDQDESFVRRFLLEALDMISRVLRQQTSKADKAFFSVIPKKVKEGQNKVIVLLNEPTEKEDKLKVSVDKNGERLEISSVKRRNPYTLYFQMPESCLEVSMLVSIHVEKNGQALGYRQVKCESRMRELDQILRSCDNPLEFMCQTLGFSPGDREHLDNFLVAAFQRNLPPHFSLLNTQGLPDHHRTYTSPEEYPTLLHFAARNGLEKLAWQLLECPGSEYACEIRNSCELTPAEMAEAAGHTKLANALRGYMQMTEFTSMYSYMKIMSQGNGKSTSLEETEYHQPRPLSETYQVPPTARGLMDNYQIPPTARPYHPPENEMGYMEMHPAGSHIKNSLPPAFRTSQDSLNTAATDDKSHRLPSLVPTSPDSLDQIILEEDNLSASGGIKKSHEQVHQPVSAQEELAEILNDFKNNVFTISEIEKLVENWQNRNDVRQSFKDKQEQLNHMREEYERLQQKMKDQMKRPTPFDRIRNFFKGKPKETKEPANETLAGCQGGDKAHGTESLPGCQRPASSLSLQSISSSSSSGRMSTVSASSGVSLGDSTQSDPEDRKHFSLSLDTRRFNNGIACGIQNYEIPPAPRPVKHSPPRYGASCMRTTIMLTQSSSSAANTPIEKRPPWPSPRPDTLEFEACNSSEPNGRESNSITKPGMILRSPTSKRRANKNNGISIEQRRESDSGDCEYLELADAPTDNITIDYINVPGRDSPKVGTSVRSEGNTFEELGRVGAVHSPQSPTPSEGSDLPEYVNLAASAAPPPVPPRMK